MIKHYFGSLYEALILRKNVFVHVKSSFDFNTSIVLISQHVLSDSLWQLVTVCLVTLIGTAKNA